MEFTIRRAAVELWDSLIATLECGLCVGIARSE